MLTHVRFLWYRCQRYRNLFVVKVLTNLIGCCKITPRYPEGVRLVCNIDKNKQEIFQRLEYDPRTGHFTWKSKPPKSRIKVGSLAGSKNVGGYIKINLNGCALLAHRLAFLFMGEVVPKTVDHINRDPSDNRWCNLRPSCPKGNAYNKSAQRGTLTGLKGVSWNNAKGKWSSRISVDRKRVLLGYFDTPGEAYSAYIEASRKLHQDFSIF